MGDFISIPDLYGYLMSFFKGFSCLLLFSLTYKRRKMYILRILGGAIIGFLLCIVFTLWKQSYDNQASAIAIFCRMFTNTMLNLYHLAVILFCYKENLSESTLCWCMVVAVSQIAGKSFSVILNVAGIDDKVSHSFFGANSPLWLDNTIMIAYHIAIFGLFAIMFTKRTKLQPHSKIDIAVPVVAGVSLLFTYTVGSFTRIYEDMQSNPGLTITSKLLMIFCNLLIIFISLGITQRNKLTTDLEITEQLLKQEKNQYEFSKENLETINMKFHDLRHRLEAFEGKLEKYELDNLKELFETYDANIKTGNQILDVVLYEKQLLCERNGIKINCLANGALVEFISPSHLYSLFGNAIDNAIDAVKEITDESKRLIDISIRKDDNTIVSEITNYFIGERQIKNGELATSKSDINTHGYGIKSMQYVVQQYNGKISFNVLDDIFITKICFKGE